MKKIAFYPHETSLNHGCEAIIVSTALMFKRFFPEISLLHYNRNDDISLITKYVDVIFVTKRAMRRFSLHWFIYLFLRYVLKKFEYLGALRVKHNFDAIKDNDIFLSIGGDNYCYGKPYEFYGMNFLIKKQGKRSVFWGCSIEEKKIDEAMIADLNRFDLIITRESLSYNTLHSLKLRSKLVLCPDPAFTLPFVEWECPFMTQKQKVIGINISPMIMKNEQYKGITLQAYKELVQYILKETDYSIAFIPHVTVKTTDDRLPLRELYDYANDEKRTTLIDDCDCQRLKYVISRCYAFVGARTHSTIAAYSTCVPTLVVGYSVKAMGIAKDIFGSYENYVLPVQHICNDYDLKNAFIWFMKKYSDIKTHLDLVMPNYVNNAYRSVEEVLKLG